MDNQIFKVGSVVHLNSDPKVIMTIRNIYNDVITAQWFSSDNKLQNADFTPDELILVS